MGCAQLLFGGSIPTVATPSRMAGSNGRSRTRLRLNAPMVSRNGPGGSPSSSPIAPRVGAWTGGWRGGMNRCRTFSSKITQALWPGCSAIRRPQIAYRFGQNAWPSS